MEQLIKWITQNLLSISYNRLKNIKINDQSDEKNHNWMKKMKRKFESCTINKSNKKESTKERRRRRKSCRTKMKASLKRITENWFTHTHACTHVIFFAIVYYCIAKSKKKRKTKQKPLLRCLVFFFVQFW